MIQIPDQVIWGSFTLVESFKMLGLSGQELDTSSLKLDRPKDPAVTARVFEAQRKQSQAARYPVPDSFFQVPDRWFDTSCSA